MVKKNYYVELCGALSELKVGDEEQKTLVDIFIELGHSDEDWVVISGAKTFFFETRDDRDEFLQEIGLTLGFVET